MINVCSIQMHHGKLEFFQMIVLVQSSAVGLNGADKCPEHPCSTAEAFYQNTSE